MVSKMKLITYNEILDQIHTYEVREALPLIAKNFPSVSMKALGSIYSQEYQKKMRKTHHYHYCQDTMENYYKRFMNGIETGEKQILIRLSEEIELSPALLARIIMERHLAHTKYDGENPPKGVVTQLMKEPSLIEEPDIAVEIHLSILSDDHYGPLCDSIKHSFGHEYEFKLKRTLDKFGLSYIGEEQMRAKGYDKTPDIKLEVPIAVDGHVINWIESKASFGDEYSHKMYLKDQFWSYWNRFGPGMVIYWFGFIEELDVNRDKGIILHDDFPENIVRMNPSLR
ncbi:hypothetical protein CHS0354_042615 [Potamilus streckersoni]|uniref:CDAN1-interacting nuclease 1 n=1 Tax=Potamilus streckersoni TaxID=2493646 RepID=A0AAE0TDX4_9BIVA|nr:hypothetical protein CHS0354_042615 [Potamilus streckersoni]